MTEINSANTESNYVLIEQLADTIWREHYIPIVGKPQIDYMLEKYQSAKAISEQVINGHEYFVLNYNKIPVGYIAIKPEAEVLFLSKIYVLSSYRGNKIGKAAMLFIEAKAKTYHLKTIMLTVNKNNIKAIKTYEKFGFINVKPLVTDIGNDFVMDDYQMEKEV